jgi:RNA polymerase sigma-70 factor, ECF subfamily
LSRQVSISPRGVRRTYVTVGARSSHGAFAELVEPHRAELEAHCRRVVGSIHDAEDALQEALLRAWRGLPGFEGRSSTRSWLFRIATNTSLDAIERRRKTVPLDPEEAIGIQVRDGAPDVRYEERESVELAFVVALQVLPERQLAVLVLRDVLGFSARETGQALEMTVAAVNSALQRARATLEARLPQQSRRQAPRMLRDQRLRELVDRSVEAWERGDIDALVTALADGRRRR